MKEYELFEPVKGLFTKMGFKVNAEVKDCDMTAIKDERLIITELKKNLSVRLLAQALERQKSGAEVYIAVPKPAKYSPKKFRETLYVIKKLELGLIFVTLKGSFSYAEIIHEPQPFKPVRTRTKERKQIITEINGRALDNNIGGVTNRKIATAFTEKSIYAACVLEKYGVLSPKSVSEHMDGADIGGLLYRNSYGWFERPEKGKYQITEKCREEISAYPELLGYYRDLVNNKGSVPE